MNKPFNLTSMIIVIILLASCAGNALEVLECVRLLRGEESNARLAELSILLSAELLSLGGLGGEEEVRAALDSGVWRRLLNEGARRTHGIESG